MDFDRAVIHKKYSKPGHIHTSRSKVLHPEEGIRGSTLLHARARATHTQARAYNTHRESVVKCLLSLTLIYKSPPF